MTCILALFLGKTGPPYDLVKGRQHPQLYSGWRRSSGYRFESNVFHITNQMQRAKNP